MKEKFAGIVIGIAIIVFGIILYPYWVNYVTTPLFDWLENSFLPSIMETVPAWVSLIFAIAPFAMFALIIFAGVMYIRNKLHRKESE